MTDRSVSFDSDVDLLRLLSAYFVVIIHVAGRFSPACVIYNSLARFSVPVFVLISGYYLLSRETPVGVLWKKALRLMALMVFWAGVYYLYSLSQGAAFEGAKAAVKYLLTQPMHLWYLYAAAALYVFTPVFFVFARSAGRQEWHYALALFFFFGSVVTVLLRSPWFPTLTLIVDKTKVPWLLGFPFLYLLGGYLRRFPLESPRARRVIYLLGLLGFAGTAAGTWALSARTQVIDGLLMSFFSPGAILPAAAVFVAVKERVARHPLPEKLRLPLHRAAGCTMGAYLIHPLVKMVLQNQLHFPFESLPQWAGLPLRAALVYVLALALTFVLKKLPGVGKLMG